MRQENQLVAGLMQGLSVRLDRPMKSPGQAAREAYIHMRPEDYSEHDFWDAIAQAAIDASPLAAEFNKLSDEYSAVFDDRDDSRQRYDRLAAAARAVDEMATRYGSNDTSIDLFDLQTTINALRAVLEDRVT